MRIISKFHDYYDSVQKYGQDLNTVYLRNDESLDPKKFESFKDFLGVYQVRHGLYASVDFSYIPFIVLISDKSYFGFKLTYKKDGTDQEIVEYCYDEKSCVDFLDRNSTTYLKEYSEKKKGWRYHYYRTDFNAEKVPEFFETKIPGTQKICIEYASPVILIGKKGCYSEVGPFGPGKDLLIIKNPCLKNIEFYKALDTNSAFQEIESFLTGVLPATVPNMVTVSEKNKILKHGFDYKLSFRKPTSKKK